METLLAPIFDATLHALEQWGIWAIFVLMILESMCIPAPSELIMLYAGYLVSVREDGSFGDMLLSDTFLWVVAAGVAGNLIGSWIAWLVGARAGREFIEQHGKWLHINARHLAWADAWFDRHGPSTVFFTRNMPIIRTFISLPAGIAEMPLGRFTTYTFIGCIPWVFMLATIGTWMGPRWEVARDVLHYGDYLVVALLAAGATWLALRRVRRRRSTAGQQQ